MDDDNVTMNQSSQADGDSSSSSREDDDDVVESTTVGKYIISRHGTGGATNLSLITPLRATNLSLITPLRHGCCLLSKKSWLMPALTIQAMIGML
jgi:hypothetical protein